MHEARVGLVAAHGGVQDGPDALLAQGGGRQQAALQIVVQRPVGQAGDASAAGHQLRDHGGEFGLAHGFRGHPGRVEEAGENIQAIAVDRVGDEGFVGQVLGLDPCPPGQGMILGDGQHRFIAEQGHVAQPQAFHRVGGDDQVEVAAAQGRQGREVKSGGDVNLHLRPSLAVGVYGRQQPLDAAVALDGDENAPGFPARQPRKVRLRAAHQGQHFVGQAQQPQPGTGEAHRPGLAHEQPAADPAFKLLELMG